MGGSKDPALSEASNLLLLCGSGTEGCHGWVESNRAVALDDGLLVRRGHDAAETPVTLRYGTVYLTDDGGVQPC
jgi:hypothetical protein